MAFKDIYDSSLEPIYPAKTNRYISDIPAVDTLSTPEELAKHPERIGAYVMHCLDMNISDLRDIETSRRAIAYRASVLQGLFELCAEQMEALPEDVKTQAQEWAKRLKPEPKESI